MILFSLLNWSHLPCLYFFILIDFCCYCLKNVLNQRLTNFFLKSKISILGFQAICRFPQLPSSALVAQKQPGQYINKCLSRAHNWPTLDQDLRYCFLWNFIRKCVWLYNFKRCLRISSFANIGKCWLHFYVILRLQLFSLKIL